MIVEKKVRERTVTRWDGVIARVRKATLSTGLDIFGAYCWAFGGQGDRAHHSCPQSTAHLFLAIHVIRSNRVGLGWEQSQKQFTVYATPTLGLPPSVNNKSLLRSIGCCAGGGSLHVTFSG